LASLALLPHLRSLWLNHSLESALHESVALIQADQVWAPPIGVTGRGVGVAVLDSGIDGTHPDIHFPEHTKQNVKLLGDQHVLADQTFTVENVADTDTTTGHGTHVAGIIAGDGTASGGYYEGVAPGADLIGVGAADGLDMLTALAGYDWILKNNDTYHIRVVNNSWADGTITYDPNDPLNQASLAAHNAGITVVFAAGNDGHTGANVLNRYAWPSWVISAGGGTKTGELGDYSSGGDSTHHPTLVAPGSFIASARALTGVVTDANSTPFDLTDPNAPRVVPAQWTPYYTVALGTSMAAPHLAGTVALMLEANPALTPDQVAQIVASTATPMPGCPVANCGSGYLNALAAVQASLAAVNHAPVAALSASPASGAAPLDTTLSAAGTTDPDGDAIASYRWDYDGDGVVDATTSNSFTTHQYGPGAYHPTVVAVDARGLASAPVSVEVRSADPPHAAASAPKHASSGASVTVDASASTDPTGSTLTYHFEFGDGTSTTTTSATATHLYAVARPSVFVWSVTVTNSAGVADADSGTIKITP
jgi:serine protease AprX